MSPLPLIDVEKYFNDPAIPDGNNVGFVSPHGVVHDAQGRPIGIDSKHENAKNQDALDRLRRLIEGGMEASAQLSQSMGGQVGAPADYESEKNRPGGFNYIKKRQIEQHWTHGEDTFALDNFGDLWVLDASTPNGLHWSKADRKPALPPLPQGA